jgi:hypothetical protein
MTTLLRFSTTVSRLLSTSAASLEQSLLILGGENSTPFFGCQWFMSEDQQLFRLELSRFVLFLKHDLNRVSLKFLSSIELEFACQVSHQMIGH